MASGIVKQISAIPAPTDANHVVKVRATFTGQGLSGGDWGSAYRSRLFIVQNGVTTYGDYLSHQTTRTAYAMEAQFSANANQAITVGLYCSLSGAVSFTYYDVTLQAEVLKR